MHLTRKLFPVSIVVAAGLVVASFAPIPGCQRRDLKTRIGTRLTYDGPTTGPSTGTSAVEDWPRWRGPRGDGISHEVIAESWPAPGPRKLWSADVGLGYSSPIAADGRVYLFSLDNKRDALTCFDAGSGRIVWNDLSESGWAGNYPGTRSTPAIDGDAIYTYGGGGELLCRDLATGKPRWRANVLEVTGSGNLGFGVASSPLVYDDLVVVQNGSDGPIALAFDKRTGANVWKSAAQGVGGYAHPILADVQGTRQLIVFGGDALHGMHPATGGIIWRIAWKTGSGVNSVTPVYADGHVFVTSSYGMGCMMVRLTPTGAVKLWSNKSVKSRFQQVILDGKALYANSEGTLTCLSWPDGAVKWKVSESDLDLSGNEHGSIVRVSADKILLMSDRGQLVLGRATADLPFQKLATFPTFDEREVWSTPLIYGGRLYAKSTREFACFDIGPGMN